MNIVHVPTPGDHYSPRTGSAVMTVIYELSRVHAKQGGSTKVIVSRGTCDGYPPYDVGQIVETDMPLSLPGKSKRAMDALCGRVLLRRPASAGMYANAGAAIGRNFDGIVFVHNAPGSIPVLRKALPNARLCLYAHNELFSTYGRREIARVLDRCDRMICVSQFIANDVLARLGRASDKPRAVLNGVDIERFRPAATPTGNDPPVILFLGRVVQAKGVDLLVRAAVILKERGVRFRLRIVGSMNFNSADKLTPYEQSLRDLGAPLGDSIEFWPFTDRTKVLDVYQKADLFCAPSAWDDPCPLTVPEAMACGLPIVASRMGGIPEEGGDAVLYFNPPDVSALANTLERLLADSELRSRVGQAARSRAATMSWQAQYERLKETVADSDWRCHSRQIGMTIESRSSVPIFVHVPTPGDHYSTATGSATISVIHEIVRKHILAGGEARIIVGRDTMHDLPDGQCVEVDFPAHRNRTMKIIDVGLGRIGAGRWFEQAIYRPAIEAIDRDFDGPVLVYNAPGAIAAIKKHRPRAKVCLWAVNALFRTYNRAEIGRVIAASHRIICCSQFIANDLTLRLGQKSPKIKVVYNGVDMGKFLPGQSTVGNVGRILRILFIGRMVPQKGPDLLLKAAQLVHRKGVPFKLRMVGSRGYGLYKDLSPYEEELRTLAEPIKDSVEFQPSISRDELLKEYQAADVFCAPSNWDDPFPLTVLEAMSCGVPTVASRRGGIPEGGAEDILYFNPPDFAELAERLCFFLCDPKLRLEYSARCRTRAMRFDWQNQYHDLQRALTE